MAVLGIGGLFFRAKDPDALNTWYREWLGVGAGCVSDPDVPANEWVWQTSAGPVVFAPFKADTDYFPADKAFRSICASMTSTRRSRHFATRAFP